jgi:Ser/Thr protein kinase RdoA (MazF antagonist)
MDANVPMSAPGRPFDGLEPGVILDAVEHFGVRCDGRLLALNSFENRVYQVGSEDGLAVVAKFYRPARWSDASILEEHAFSRELAEREMPVVAPLEDAAGSTLAGHAGFRYAVYPSVGGYWPELQDRADRSLLGRLVGRLHAVGSIKSFRHRPAIDAESYGARSADFLLEGNFLPPGIDGAYRRVTDELLDRVRERYARVPQMQLLRLHGDLHRGNILWSGQGCAIVDLDDCRSGPAIQDLWMLLAGSDHDIRVQLNDLLGGYRTFFDFDHREILLVEALRALRMMHHAAWLAKRWADPAFPIAFPWFNTPAYWEGHLTDLREQAAKLAEPAVAVI